MRDYLAEDVVHLVGIGEDAAATMFGGDSAHGTANVPVDFVIAYIVETVGELNELNRLFTQNLGDDGDRVVIGLG